MKLRMRFVLSNNIACISLYGDVQQPNPALSTHAGVESATPGVIKRLVCLEKNYLTPRVASAKHHQRTRTRCPGHGAAEKEREIGNTESQPRGKDHLPSPRVFCI